MSQNSKKAVLIYSGGLDSTVLLHEMVKSGFEVHALSINYGQRHEKEQKFAKDNCKELAVDFMSLTLPIGAVLRGSSQTDSMFEVPRGHYADDSMKVTVVPNRNMIMLALAGAHAISLNINTLMYAAHAGDHAIYPDCRPEFVNAMRVVFHACHFTPIHLLAPYLHLTKAQIVEQGVKFDVDFSNTWSCYIGGDVHCGTCGTCVERREAFQLANVPDPTQYHEI